MSNLQLPRPASVMDCSAVLSAVCAAKGMWGLRLEMAQGTMDASADLLGDDGVVRPAPYLVEDDLGGTGWNNLWLLFPTEAEMRACLAATVGPDGPAPMNSHEGPSQVRSLVACGPDGSFLETAVAAGSC